MSTPVAAKSLLNESRRPPAKARIVSARVTEAEYGALESEAWKAGRTVGDWTRECLLRELKPTGATRLDRYVFTELVGIQLLLMNTLGPLLRGERITAEQMDSLLRQVQSTKTRKAQELLSKRLSGEERSA